MSFPSICSGIFQPLDIGQYLPPQVILNLHIRERGIDFEDLLAG
jgi:hypothetical protein